MAEQPLALHHLTMREVTFNELIETAAELDCPEICVFTHAPRIPVPGAAFTLYPLVERSNLEQVKASLSSNGVRVSNIEFFPVTEGLDLSEYEASFAIGAEIGAQRAVTHIHDTEPSRALDTLGRLCDLAAGFELKLGLEFMGLTPACNSIGAARWFVEQVARDNIGIALDALHLVRTGGTAAQVLATLAQLFCYAQICDGFGQDIKADYRPEGQDRLPPGDGNWPLQEIFMALPLNVPIDVEVPSTTLAARGVLPRARAYEAVTKARELLIDIQRLR